MRFKQYLMELAPTYSKASVAIIWQEANRVCFNGELNSAEFSVEQNLSKYLQFFTAEDGGGEMLAFCDWSNVTFDSRQKPYDMHKFTPVLRFVKHIKDRQTLEQIVVHEMVHQRIAQDVGYAEMCNIGHGPGFMKYSAAVRKFKNVELSETVGND